jgi:hypothetical protein
MYHLLYYALIRVEQANFLINNQHLSAHLVKDIHRIGLCSFIFSYFFFSIFGSNLGYPELDRLHIILLFFSTFSPVFAYFFELCSQCLSQQCTIFFSMP